MTLSTSRPSPSLSPHSKRFKKIKKSPRTGNRNGLLTSKPPFILSAKESIDKMSEIIEKEDSIKAKKMKMDNEFDDHFNLNQRVSKSMYYADKVPLTPRPSFPLTVLAVNAFTNGALYNNDCLKFLDLEMASEIGRKGCVSHTALVMAIVYLERMSQNNPTYLSTIKPSELFVISLLVASKFIQDDGEDMGIYNDEWASSGRMTLSEINKLEIDFLTAMDWKVNVTKDEFDKVLEKIEERLAFDEGMKRGWFTYKELDLISEKIFTWNFLWPIMSDYIIKTICAAYITYSAVLTTVLASSMTPYIFLVSKGLIISQLAPLNLNLNQLISSYGYLSNSNEITCPNYTSFYDSIPILSNEKEIQIQLPVELEVENKENPFNLPRNSLFSLSFEGIQIIKEKNKMDVLQFLSNVNGDYGQNNYQNNEILQVYDLLNQQMLTNSWKDKLMLRSITSN